MASECWAGTTGRLARRGRRDETGEAGVGGQSLVPGPRFDTYTGYWCSWDRDHRKVGEARQDEAGEAGVSYVSFRKSVIISSYGSSHQ